MSVVGGGVIVLIVLWALVAIAALVARGTSKSG